MLAETNNWPWFGIALAITLVWMVVCVIGGNLGSISPLGILALAGAGYVFWQAGFRRHWALITVLAAVLLLLDISFVSRDIGEPGLDAQNGMKLVAWAGLIGMSLLNTSRIMRHFRDPVILAFGCFFAICLISTLYSPVPLVTGTASLGMIAYLTFACLLVDEIPERTLYRTLFWTLATYCLANLLSALVLPDVAFHHVIGEPDDVERLQGIAGQPNQLGRTASMFLMLTMIVAWRGYVRTIWWAPMILLGIVLTFWSGSRTAVLGVFLALLLQLPRRHLIVVGGVMILVIGGIIATGQVETIMGLVGREGSAEEAWTLVLTASICGTSRGARYANDH